MTGRSVCFGLFSLLYLRLECDVDYAYNAPSADSMRNRRGNCFEKNLIFLPTGVRCVTPSHAGTSVLTSKLVMLSCAVMFCFYRAIVLQ